MTHKLQLLLNLNLLWLSMIVSIHLVVDVDVPSASLFVQRTETKNNKDRNDKIVSVVTSNFKGGIYPTKSARWNPSVIFGYCVSGW